MAFSFIVELLNMFMRKKTSNVVKLNAPSLEEHASEAKKPS
jgi:hypothetical protein